MDWLRTFLDFFRHPDVYLLSIISQYGFGTNLILFLIIFAETGLVVTPFLPGDSLLFAAGALAARPEANGALNPYLLCVILSIAAILGDTVNYWVGSYLGNRLIERFPRLIKREYVERTHQFFEKYGGKTIIIARFVPIVRTFAPFVAGIGAMNYRQFIFYNIVGGIGWVVIFVMAGYMFGQIQFVRERFEVVAVAIVLISVLPIVYEFIRARRPRSTSEPTA